MLVIVGIALAGFGMSRSVGGYDWADDTAVPTDGQPHEVRTDNGSVWVWSLDAYTAPTCTATDVDGAPLQMRELKTGATRPGKIGDYVPLVQFNSYDDPALLTCDPPDGGSEVTVHAEPAPKVVALASVDPWVVRGALIGLLGLAVLLVGALVRRATRAA